MTSKPPTPCQCNAKHQSPPKTFSFTQSVLQTVVILFGIYMITSAIPEAAMTAFLSKALPDMFSNLCLLGIVVGIPALLAYSVLSFLNIFVSLAPPLKERLVRTLGDGAKKVSKEEV